MNQCVHSYTYAGSHKISAPCVQPNRAQASAPALQLPQKPIRLLRAPHTRSPALSEHPHDPVPCHNLPHPTNPSLSCQQAQARRRTQRPPALQPAQDPVGVHFLQAAHALAPASLTSTSRSPSRICAARTCPTPKRQVNNNQYLRRISSKQCYRGVKGWAAGPHLRASLHAGAGSALVCNKERCEQGSARTIDQERARVRLRLSALHHLLCTDSV